MGSRSISPIGYRLSVMRVALDHALHSVIVPALTRFALRFAIARSARPRSSTDRTEVSIFHIQRRPRLFILSNLRKFGLA
jgi:hypothetical protein